MVNLPILGNSFHYQWKLVWGALGQWKLVWRALGQFPNGILKEFLSKSIEIVWRKILIAIPFKLNGNWSGWRALDQFPNGILKEFLSKSTEIGLERILMEFLSKSMEIGLESSWSISQWNP